MRLQEIPSDLRATLSLLLGQHKRYGEIAALLNIEERAVHDRAHAALALLAPRQARELSAAQRKQVGEYLLGQASPAEQSAAVTYLESSAAGRAWAQTLAGELAPLASVALPVIPTGGSASEEPIANGAAPDAGIAPTAASDAPAPGATQALSSRRGGAILLGGLAVVVVVAVALIVGLGGGSSPSSATTSTTPGASSGAGESTSASTTPSTTSGTSAKSGKSGKSGSEPHLTATLPLTPPDTTSKALGLVEVIAEGNEHAFILAAEHLPPTDGFHYAAWLYNTPTDAYFLGGGTTVNSKGTLKAAQALPADAAHYATIILTEEHEEHPKQPGPIVLSGSFKLG
jgi:hypothetical protein